MNSFIIILNFLLAYSGEEKPSEVELAKFEQPDKFLEINCENILKNKKMVFLSQVASNVRYIRLETNPSCLINNHFSTKFFFADSLIFVQNMTHVLKFSIDGKFIKRIAKAENAVSHLLKWLGRTSSLPKLGHDSIIQSVPNF